MARHTRDQDCRPCADTADNTYYLSTDSESSCRPDADMDNPYYLSRALEMEIHIQRQCCSISRTSWVPRIYRIGRREMEHLGKPSTHFVPSIRLSLCQRPVDHACSVPTVGIIHPTPRFRTRRRDVVRDREPAQVC